MLENVTGKKAFAFNLKNNLPSGLVVFLVALPLCLGIALASGAPLFSGLITGIVGGIVVSLFSGSSLSVSGPAAGLTVIVINAIHTLGSFDSFLLAVLIAGILQITLGFIKAGSIANYFPSSVIKGMLAAIGIILIIKQIPHAVGYDADYEGDMDFIQPDNQTSFSELLVALNKISPGATLIALVSMAILIGWQTSAMKKFQKIPAPLIVVIVGILMNIFLGRFFPVLQLGENHLVQIPVASSFTEFIGLFTLPDFSKWNDYNVYVVAITLAIVASIETLLSIEAIDKLDPLKRVSPPNKELKAQGIGNIVASLLGGLPMTAVIVRGSANVNAGAKSQVSSFIHGIFLLIAVVIIPKLINQIPLACLAAILLMTGYKLAKVELIKGMYKAGWNQFIPFVVTILAIVLTDLLKGIAVGMGVGIFFILRNHIKNSHQYHNETEEGRIKIVFSEEVSFLNKASILNALEKLPPNCEVIIDGSNSKFIDQDVLEILYDFKVNSKLRNIKVKFTGIEHPNLLT